MTVSVDQIVPYKSVPREEIRWAVLAIMQVEIVQAVAIATIVPDCAHVSKAFMVQRAISSRFFISLK